MKTMNNQMIENRIEFNSYDEWNNFTIEQGIDCPLFDLNEVLQNLMKTEEFTSKQKRSFISSELSYDNIKVIHLYKNRIFVCFKDVEYHETEYADNGITTLEIVYYPNNNTWHFAY
jgi:hypothetical protein